MSSRRTSHVGLILLLMHFENVQAPPALYQGAVAAGAAKAKADWGKIFKLGMVSGCHIGFGAYLAITVGGACPGIAAENPGLQKVRLFFAFIL